MDSLKDLDLFVAVARAKSFTEAAKALNMPTSTLSRRIADLENSVGLQLFLRSTRRVELTAAGMLYFSRGEAVVQAALDARQEVRGLAETPSGLLRISLEAEIGPILVAPVVAEFVACYPKVTLNLDLSPRRVDLMAEGFDIAIRLGEMPDSSLIVRRLGLLRVGLFASPGYLDANGTPETPADLRRHARIHLLHQDDDGAWRLYGPNRETATVAAGSVITANNMTMIRALVRRDLGISVLDEIMAQEDMAAGMLRRVLPDWSMPPVAVSALTAGRLLPAKTRLFIDMLAARLARSPLAIV